MAKNSYNKISHCATMHRFLQFIPFNFHNHKLIFLSPVLKWSLFCFGQQHIKGNMNVNSMTLLYAEGLTPSHGANRFEELKGAFKTT